MLTEWVADGPAFFRAHPNIDAVHAAASGRPAYRATLARHALPRSAV